MAHLFIKMAHGITTFFNRFEVGDKIKSKFSCQKPNDSSNRYRKYHLGEKKIFGLFTAHNMVEFLKAYVD